uniref:Uncharacterized protein n=1 Tax=Babesia bovis TaxID=5865 RepID=A7APK6_BABBO|eukprot:XP_001612058.1 hypothetical protein [Babesia bovis T2Bo]
MGAAHIWNLLRYHHFGLRQLHCRLYKLCYRHSATDDIEGRFRHVNNALSRTDGCYDQNVFHHDSLDPKVDTGGPSADHSGPALDSEMIRSIPLERIEDALLQSVPENIRTCSIENESLTPGQLFYLENRDKLLENLRRRYFEESGVEAPSDGEIESILPLLMEEEKYGSYDHASVVSPGKHHLWDYDTGAVSSRKSVTQSERIMHVSVVDMDSCNRRDQGMYCIVGTGATRSHCRRVGRLLYRVIVDLEIPFVSDTSYCCHSRSDEWIVARLGPLCVHLMVKEVREKQSIEDIWEESRVDEGSRVSQSLPEMDTPSDENTLTRLN